MISDIAWIKDIIYVMPLGALIWKAAQQASEIKEMRKDIDFAHDKIRKEEEKRDCSIDEVIKTVTEIKINVVEIKAKLEGKHES